MPSKSEQVKEKLARGLIRLLDRQPFDRITVTRLCRESGVSRTAFYSHYRKPEDILTDALCLAMDEATELAGERLREDKGYFLRRDFIRDFIEFFDRNSELLLVLSKWDLLDPVSFTASKKVAAALEGYDGDPYIRRYPEYYQYFCFGSLYYLCLLWARRGKRESKEELFRLCAHFYAKGSG